MDNERTPRSTAWRIVKAAIFLIFAGFILFSFETAADLISRGGNGISQIESVGGKTLEEAYYYQLGFVYKGYALVVQNLGRIFAVLIAYLGAKK